MASSSKTILRKDCDVYLIGSFSSQIVGNKLPSNRQVLKVLFFNLRQVKLKLQDSARLAVKETVVFWEKGRIPTQSDKNCIPKLKKLYEEWRSIQKSSSKRSNKQKEKEQVFVEKLDDIFDMAHENAFSLMKIEEDKEFLKQQRQKGRPGYMCGIDKNAAEQEKRFFERAKKTEQFKKRKIEEVEKLTYIQKGGYNVILTQAERLLAGPDYIHAAANCKPTGKFAASFIDYLVTKGLSLANLHVIGFSLGGQIAGFVGKSVSSGKLTRITALDPAGPLFTAVSSSERISPADAHFVDVIHSNAYIFGLKYSVGDVDFWPNGGGPGQPGCSIVHIIRHRGFALNWLVFCNHYRAYQLYAQSVNEAGVFPAKKCRDRKHYKTGNCKNEVNYLGIAANPINPGNYYLNTGLAAVNV